MRSTLSTATPADGDDGSYDIEAGNLSPPAQSVRVSGWLYKSPSRVGPPGGRAASAGGAGATEENDAAGGLQRRLSTSLLAAGRSARLSLLPSQAEGIPTPQDKRWFVLDGHELRWYGNKDEATLGMAPKTVVDMRLYSCKSVDDGELLMALLPAAAPAKKSWYLRAEDAESFETWKWALDASSAAAAAQAEGAVPSLDEDPSGSSSASEATLVESSRRWSQLPTHRM